MAKCNEKDKIYHSTKTSFIMKS